MKLGCTNQPRVRASSPSWKCGASGFRRLFSERGSSGSAGGASEPTCFLLCTECGLERGSGPIPLPSGRVRKTARPNRCSQCATEPSKQCAQCNRWLCGACARDDMDQCRLCPYLQAQQGQVQPPELTDITRGKKAKPPQSLLPTDKGGQGQGGQGQGQGRGEVRWWCLPAHHLP